MHLGMARTIKAPPVRRGSRPRRPPPKLYIGAWLRRLGLKQVDVASAAAIGQSHMSLIVKGERYPGPGTLEAIATAMGVTAETLKKPPPDEATIRATADIDPAILARLGQNLPKN
jgi:transcriptional regulator with XRE-family HTH domain